MAMVFSCETMTRLSSTATGLGLEVAASTYISESSTEDGRLPRGQRDSRLHYSVICSLISGVWSMRASI